MKHQRGFIQIPVLIAIFVGLLVVGGGGYEGVKVYKKNQETKKETQLAQEKKADAILEAQVIHEEQVTVNNEVATSTATTSEISHKEPAAPKGVSSKSPVTQPNPLAVTTPLKQPEAPKTVALSTTTPEKQTTNTTDTTPPSTPTGLSGSAISSSGISLLWDTSSDNVGVSGYKIFRAGIEIANTQSNSFSDSLLLANTAYSYAVVAYDVAGNTSPQSWVTSVTTKTAVVVVPPPPPPPPPKIKFVRIEGHDGVSFTVESNKEIDFSKTQIIKGIWSSDITTGSCNGFFGTTTGQPGERRCVDFNEKTEVLPVSVASIVKAENSPNGVPRCSPQFHVCDDALYTITISPPLTSFSERLYVYSQIVDLLYIKFRVYDFDGNSVTLPEMDLFGTAQPTAVATYGQ